MKLDKENIKVGIFVSLFLVVMVTIVGLGVNDHVKRHEQQRKRYIDCVQQAGHNGITDSERIHIVCGNE